MHKDQRFTSNEHWQSLQAVDAMSYRCGYCSSDTGSASGLKTDGGSAFVRVCPYCNGPTFFARDDNQWPGPKLGMPVSHLPPDVQSIYEEARSSIAANAPTGGVMLCRKILMHTAVEKEAKEGLSFQQYVKWLVDERYAPRGAERWLDYIRNRANEANHEILVMPRDDAIAVLRFTEALLRGVYELPGLVPAPSESGEETDDESGD